jgi:malonyl CoA-acyl carrier protein transacylase
MGEYLAACLAGVMSLADTLRLIAVRAKLVNELPQALMLAVMVTEEELRKYLQSGLFISLINGPTHCVVAGPPAEVTALEEALEAKDIIARRVQNGHAFHTMMMAPILGAFEAELRKTPLSAPRIPYISNVTGDWITAAQATDPVYWQQHLTQTARFDQGLQALWRLANPVLVECGPGRTLSVLAAQHPDRKGTLQSAIWSIRQRYENESDEQVLLSALGKVWLAGAAVRWERARARGAEPQRLALPMPAPELEPLAQSSESSAPQPQPQADEPGVVPPNKRERELIAIWQTALGRDVSVNDSFGALGGDSLNSIGALMDMKRAGFPDEVARGLYQGLTIRQMVRQEAELASGAAPRSFNAQISLSSVEMPVFIRAVGIYLVVASHLGITWLLGNPMLMIVSGLSFAKFQLLAVAKERSIRPVLRFMLRIAIPAMLDTLARQLAHHSFHPRSFLLMDNLLEPHPFGPHQSPWFIDLLLQNFLIAALPLTIAPVRRFAASRPYVYGMIFLCVSGAASIVIPLFFDQQHVWLMVPHVFMWLLAFGWCAAYSRSYKQKLLASILFVCFNTISNHWGHAFEWEAVAAALALTWLDELPAQIPTVLVRLISAVAAASLFIYLTHFVCYYAIQALWTHVTGRPLSEFSPLWSIPFVMAGGYVAWRIWNYGTRVLLRWLGQKPKLSSEPAGSW